MGRDSESLQLELRTNLAKKLLVDRQRKVWKKLDICADDRLHNSLDYVSGEGPIHAIKKNTVSSCCLLFVVSSNSEFPKPTPHGRSLGHEVQWLLRAVRKYRVVFQDRPQHRYGQSS
jgi:hypothetical protein